MYKLEIRTQGKKGVITFTKHPSTVAVSIVDSIQTLYGAGCEKVLIDLRGLTEVDQVSFKNLIAFQRQDPGKPFAFFGGDRKVTDLLRALRVPKPLFFPNEALASDSLVFAVNQKIVQEYE